MATGTPWTLGHSDHWDTMITVTPWPLGHYDHWDTMITGTPWPLGHYHWDIMTMGHDHWNTMTTGTPWRYVYQRTDTTAAINNNTTAVTLPPLPPL